MTGTSFRAASRNVSRMRPLHAQTLNDRVYVQRRGIQRGNIPDDRPGQKQCQLRPAQNNSIDIFFFAKAADNRYDSIPRFVAKLALESLADVTLVNPRPLFI